MTEQQEKALVWLKKAILENDGLGRDHMGGYEYKKWEVTESHGHVFLQSEVGLKGDEHTMASLLCRRYRHIVIGPKGGLRLLNTKGTRSRHRQARGRSVVWKAVD